MDKRLPDTTTVEKFALKLSASGPEGYESSLAFMCIYHRHKYIVDRYSLEQGHYNA